MEITVKINNEYFHITLIGTPDTLTLEQAIEQIKDAVKKFKGQQSFQLENISYDDNIIFSAGVQRFVKHTLDSLHIYHKGVIRLNDPKPNEKPDNIFPQPIKEPTLNLLDYHSCIDPKILCGSELVTSDQFLKWSPPTDNNSSTLFRYNFNCQKTYKNTYDSAEQGYLDKIIPLLDGNNLMLFLTETGSHQLQVRNKELNILSTYMCPYNVTIYSYWPISKNYIIGHWPISKGYDYLVIFHYTPTGISVLDKIKWVKRSDVQIHKEYINENLIAFIAPQAGNNQQQIELFKLDSKAPHFNLLHIFPTTSKRIPYLITQLNDGSIALAYNCPSKPYCQTFTKGLVAMSGPTVTPYTYDAKTSVAKFQNQYMNIELSFSQKDQYIEISSWPIGLRIKPVPEDIVSAFRRNRKIDLSPFLKEEFSDVIQLYQVNNENQYRMVTEYSTFDSINVHPLRYMNTLFVNSIRWLNPPQLFSLTSSSSEVTGLRFNIRTLPQKSEEWYICHVAQNGMVISTSTPWNINFCRNFTLVKEFHDLVTNMALQPFELGPDVQKLILDYVGGDYLCENEITTPSQASHQTTFSKEDSKMQQSIEKSGVKTGLQTQLKHTFLNPKSDSQTQTAAIQDDNDFFNPYLLRVG